MGVSHVACDVRYPGYDGPRIWTPNTLVELPYRGFDHGDKVVRLDNPTIGLLVHICMTPDDVPRFTNRARTYGYVRFPDAGRRGSKVFDVHHHVYLWNLRLATPENVASAEAIVAERIYRQALRYGFVAPRD